MNKVPKGSRKLQSISFRGPYIILPMQDIKPLRSALFSFKPQVRMKDQRTISSKCPAKTFVCFQAFPAGIAGTYINPSTLTVFIIIPD
jgi:hypothetical protein